MTNSEASSTVGDVRPVLAAVRRNAWIVALSIILVTGAALAVSFTQQEKYASSASLLFRDPGLDRALFGSVSIASGVDPQRQAATNVTLVELRRIADRTARAVGGSLTASQVADMVDVAQQESSDVVTVTATSSNPRSAANLANTYADEFVKFRRDSDRDAILRARDALVAREGALSDGADARSLARRAEQLDTLAALQTGRVELVQPATASDAPVSPKPLRNGILAVVIGGALGLLAVLLRERFDRTIRDADEMERIYGLPVIAAIPESKRYAGSMLAMPGPIGDAFALLRTNLRYLNVDRDLKTILVTSAEAGAGKTTLASGLAASMALVPGSRVLLIDTDLRRPEVANRLDLARSPGLSEYIAGLADLDDVVQEAHVANEGFGGSSEANFDVIAAGSHAPNPFDLIDSVKTRELLRDARDRYDLVVLDTVPAPLVADAVSLMSMADGVLLVAPLGRATRDSARRISAQLSSLRVHTLGVVLNRTDEQSSYYSAYEAVAR